MSGWREAMNESPQRCISTQDGEGFTIGIINGLPDGSFKVDGDEELIAQTQKGVDLALEELNLPKERGWS